METIRLQPFQKKEATRVWTRLFSIYPSMAYNCSNPNKRERDLKKCLQWALNLVSRGQRLIQADISFPQALYYDLWEHPQKLTTISGNRIVLPDQPHQIQTLRIVNKER